MATSIVFTDGTGMVTLANGLATPADRFRGWTPDVQPYGDAVPLLASGQVVMFENRVDYTVRCSLPRIPQSRIADCLRLIAWLKRGGVITVNTGDLAARTYNCWQVPGASATLGAPDPKMLESELSLALLSATAVPLVCVYG